jgi:hypothetical protein
MRMMRPTRLSHNETRMQHVVAVDHFFATINNSYRVQFVSCHEEDITRLTVSYGCRITWTETRQRCRGSKSRLARRWIGRLCV